MMICGFGRDDDHELMMVMRMEKDDFACGNGRKTFDVDGRVAC